MGNQKQNMRMSFHDFEFRVSSPHPERLVSNMKTSFKNLNKELNFGKTNK